MSKDKKRYLFWFIIVVILVIVFATLVLAANEGAKVTKIKPKALKKGDTIGIVAPGSPVEKDQLEKGIKYLEKQGFKVITGKYLYAQDGFLAGTDEERAADINEMFKNPEVSAIICARGGYGSIRLLQKLDFEAIKKNPKIIMGYSDITTLLTAIYKKTGLVTFHGPMVAADLYRNDVDYYNGPNMLKVLTEAKPAGKLVNPRGFRDTELIFLREGRAQGELIGGNLTVLVSSLGTEYEIDTKGKILFLEEVGEPTYEIDRMLQHLKLSGKLDAAAGIVFGESVNCNPRFRTEPTLLEIVQKYANELKVPVYYGLTIGHGLYKATLPIGVQATLDSTSGLHIVESAVRD